MSRILRILAVIGLVLALTFGVSAALVTDAKISGYGLSAVSDVYFTYKSWYNTADYECWDTSGESKVWQGSSALGSYDTVQNAAVVRQGTVVHFKGTGGSASSVVSIEGPKPFSGSRATITDWAPTFVSGEEWRVTIPGDADIGDYRITMDSEFATLYVIFDVLKYKNDFTEWEFKTWGYDETTDADQYSWGGVWPFCAAKSQFTSERMTEFVCSIMGDGVKTESDAAARLAMVVEKRITWTTSPISDVVVANFDAKNLLDGTNLKQTGGSPVSFTPVSVSDARAVVADPTQVFSSGYVINGQCYIQAPLTFGLAKPLGIMSRIVWDNYAEIWSWNYHNWCEYYMPNAKMTPNPAFNGWCTMDNTRQYAGTAYDGACSNAPAMDTQQDYSFASYVFGGPPKKTPLTYVYSGSGTILASESYNTQDPSAITNWDTVSLPMYYQSSATTAKNNLPLLHDADTFRGYLTEGDRDFGKIQIGSATAATLTLTVGASYAQIFARKDESVALSPLSDTSKSSYVSDTWGDDAISSFSVSGSTSLYFMIDDAKGAKFADDYNVGEVRYYEMTIDLQGAPAATVPTAPIGLSASPVGNAMYLSWSEPMSTGGAAITGYNIYRGTSAGGESGTPVGTVSGTELSYTDALLPDGTYYYVVTAINSVGDSADSNEASGETPQGVPEIGASSSPLFIGAMFLALFALLVFIRRKRREE